MPEFSEKTSILRPQGDSIHTLQQFNNTFEDKNNTLNNQKGFNYYQPEEQLITKN